MGTTGNAHARESGHLWAQDDGCIFKFERTSRGLRHVSAGHSGTSGTFRTNARMITTQHNNNMNIHHHPPVTHIRQLRIARLTRRLEQAHQAARLWPSTRAEDLICQIERQIRTLNKPVAVSR